ncbi:MAG TPA: hypothetical protein VIG52_02515 [Methyloceanibacter sp.]|jgi:hypothetical protein
MQRKSLSDHQRWTIIDALHTAAEQYREDALRLYPNPRVSEQFDKQCREARELAELVQQGDVIELSLVG